MRRDISQCRLDIFDRSAVRSGYFPIQKLLKISPSRSSPVNSPVISLKASCASANPPRTARKLASPPDFPRLLADAGGVSLQCGFPDGGIDVAGGGALKRRGAESAVLKPTTAPKHTEERASTGCGVLISMRIDDVSRLLGESGLCSDHQSGDDDTDRTKINVITFPLIVCVESRA